jgi:3-deoxy-D-manno-octulosonate 8-phosphate phosphatase (KDO 8-P phosphatase)
MSEFPPDLDELRRKCGGIELLLLDVDGVLTDGVIAVDDLGVETKHFHVRDGWAIANWRKLGHRAAILSGRRSAAVDVRAAELGISPVIHGASEKRGPFLALLAELGLRPDQVAYMGDDLPDLPLLRSVGLAACPSDAAPEVAEFAHVVTRAAGGRGAVRELVELILTHQGAWPDLVALCRIPAISSG